MFLKAATEALMLQVMIQLRKFAQASKRIKEAVGTEASAPQLAKAVGQGDINPGDLADILNTEIKGGMDTSAFGKLCLSEFGRYTQHRIQGWHRHLCFW